MNNKEVYAKVSKAIEIAKKKLNTNMQDLVGQVITKCGNTGSGSFIETRKNLFIMFDESEYGSAPVRPVSNPKDIDIDLLRYVDYITYNDYKSYWEHKQTLSGL